MPKLPEMTQRVIDHARAGQIFRTARQRAKISLNKTADKLNISPGYLSELERGTRAWNQILFDRAFAILPK